MYPPTETKHILIVRPSTISGLGLFTQTTIAKGETLFKLFDADENGKYTNPQIEPTNWLNHSNDFNLEHFETTDPSTGKYALFARAKKEIPFGCELTVNYYEFEKLGIHTGITKILQNPAHYQNIYNKNRHLLKCDKPIGHKYFF